MILELTEKEIADVLGLINTSAFRGKDVEAIYTLKEKFKAAKYKKIEEDGERNPSQ